MTGDTYNIKVTLEGFKTLERPNIAGQPRRPRRRRHADRSRSAALNETVTVSGESAGHPVAERRAVVHRQHRGGREPADRRPQLVVADRADARRGRHDPARQLRRRQNNNIMMDGVAIMDTGNNGQMLQTNVEAIAEVKVLTSGYQAEYGRVERPADHGRHQERHEPVPRIGLRRRAQLRLEREQLGQHAERRSRRRVSKQRDWGYTLGGPVGKPGGTNKLFFFYAHEYRPRTTRRRRHPASACRRARAAGRLLADAPTTTARCST